MRIRGNDNIAVTDVTHENIITTASKDNPIIQTNDIGANKTAIDAKIVTIQNKTIAKIDATKKLQTSIAI